MREEDFLPVLGAAVSLILIGTATFSVSQGWSPVDGLYFAVGTLTT